ncbi:hypothetical protein ACT3CD_05200 [Geofilum sp. OHC36d9]|uniref:hypothetical protein n=1 Tax=Geofilum sp. OHC36d9 TaxID=3458413 RepID=UPI0040337EEB
MAYTVIIMAITKIKRNAFKVRNRAIKLFLAMGWLLIAGSLTGQTYSIYQNNTYDPVTRALFQPGINIHTAIRPYRNDQLAAYYNIDSLIQRGLNQPSGHQNILKRFVNSDLLSWKTGEAPEKTIKIRINPLFHFEAGKENSTGKSTWINMRGVMLQGQLGRNLGFYVDIYENQGVYGGYMNDYIQANGVVPAQGRIKQMQPDTRDYSQSTGYLSYNAGPWINLQAGYGKNFIGDGYRSLLLSDNAYSYPYFKMTATFWKIEYMVMMSQFLHINELVRSTDDRYDYKYGVFHYLSWNIGKRLSLGLFESVIYAAQDTTGYRGLDMNYMVPFVVYRPVEHALGSPDNVTMGLNIKYIPWKNAAIYGQFVMGEFKQDEVFNATKWWGNKQGFMLGYKNYNFLRIENLDVRTEYSQVRPYTYSHYEPITNYGHLNQPLAHPLGANFRESLSSLTYRVGRWYLNLEAMIAMHGEDYDETTSYGSNIYRPNTTRPADYGIYIGQGLKTNIQNISGSISFLINPKTNMNISIGGRYRKTSNDIETIENTFINLSLKTSLRNVYWNF